jgi:hypothetical protein
MKKRNLYSSDTPQFNSALREEKFTRITRVGIAADHGGFDLKGQLVKVLRDLGYTVVDFGAKSFTPDDDYPDFVLPLAKAVAAASVRALPPTKCRECEPA